MSDMSLRSAFVAYAAESSDVDLTVKEQQNANPEHIPVITDETTTDLEDAVQAIAEDVDKLAENGDLAEKLVDTVESMESLVSMVRSLKDAGENITPIHSRLFIAAASLNLEGRQIPTEWYEKELNQLNTSLESNAYDYSEEASEQLQKVKNTVLTVLQNAYKSFVEFLKKIVDNFRGRATSFDAAGVRLQKIADDLGNQSIPGDVRLKQSSYSSLHTATGAFNPETAVKEAFGSIDKAYDAAASQIEFLKNKTLVGSGDAFPEQSILLSGGKAIKLAGGRASLITQKKIDAEGKETGVASVSMIRNLGKELTDLAVVLNGIEKDNKKLINELDQLVKKAQAGFASSDDKEEKAGGKARLSEVVKGINSVRNIVPLAVKHATQVAKEANRFALASAARYGKGEAA